MPMVDLPLEQLETFDPRIEEPGDFEEFWSETMRLSGQQPLAVEIRPVDYPVKEVRVAKVYYDGFLDSRICGWLIEPEGRESTPAIVKYHGYCGDKGGVFEHLVWALMGFTVLAIDFRGQRGESTDDGKYSTGAAAGYITRGILDREECYFRKAFIDAVRAVDVVLSRERVRRDRVVVNGPSQGGGTALAVAGLHQGVRAVVAEVPGLACWRRSCDLALEGPFVTELGAYLAAYPERIERVFQVLNYVDVYHLAKRIHCPALVNVGLRDTLVPPSTAFAAYNQIRGAKEMRVHDFSGHEAWLHGGYMEYKLTWLKGILADS